MAENRKNSFIELLRFLFCILIFLHHSGALLDEGMSPLCPNGAIAVEFFFILSGYLSAVHFSKRDNSIENKMCTAMKYSLGKALRLLPYAAFGTLCLYAYYLLVGNKGESFLSKISILRNLPGELSFMTMSGAMPLNITDIKSAQLWFVSALMIALPIVCFLYLRFEDVFKGWIVWFLPPLLYGYLAYRDDTLFNWSSSNGLIVSGMVRALAGITLGFAAFYVTNWINKKNIRNVFVKIMATLYVLAALAYVVIFVCRENKIYDQIFAVYIIFFMIVLAFSNLSYTRVLENLKISKAFEYLGKLAMPMYCLHWTVISCATKFTNNMTCIEGIAFDMAISIALSVGLMFAVGLCHKKKAAGADKSA